MFPCSQVLLLVVKQIFPDFEFMWLVEEAKKNLPLELDFLHEGRNAEKVAHMLKNFDFLKVRKHISVYVCALIVSLTASYAPHSPNGGTIRRENGVQPLCVVHPRQLC